MSFLENLLGATLGNASGNQQHPLLSAAASLITQHGGIEGLQQKFQANDLGHIFSSWVGTGQNQPVTPDQVTQTLGHDNVQQIAQQAGVSHGEAASALAQLLPLIVDKLTPNGTAPNGNALQQGLASLLSGGLAKLLNK